MGLQQWKNRHGIGISGSRAKRKREDEEEKRSSSRDIKNKRGRKTGKEYWNPSTGKWQRTPVKRGRNLPGGSHHKGGEIGRKSDKPSEGDRSTWPGSPEFKRRKSKQTTGVGSTKGQVEREENEWGPGGQPSASDQIKAYEKSNAESLKIKSKEKSNTVKVGKGAKAKLTPQEWHGRSQASGKNSIAKMAWERKKRKALAKAKAKAKK